MNNHKSKCYWITGLSATGKTTLSTLLVDYMRNSDKVIIHLDGDELRKVFAGEGLQDLKSLLKENY